MRTGVNITGTMKSITKATASASSIMIVCKKAVSEDYLQWLAPSNSKKLLWAFVIDLGAHFGGGCVRSCVDVSNMHVQLDVAQAHQLCSA